MTRIGYIGNFGPARSTENALRYGLMRCGAEVVPIQQERPIFDASWAEFDALLYTRTHNRTALGPEWIPRWRQLEAAGVRTAAVHLDVFVGLRRYGIAADFSNEPMFAMEHCFSPDPALASRIAAEHHWLPPAADIRAGDPDPAGLDLAPGRVVFVGSRYGTGQLHPEYPFRIELLRWLEDRFAERFLWFGGDSPNGAPRGEQLWRIYESDALIIGDSCFAGSRPHYWSDRVPETLGHGGLLLHPWIEGIEEAFPDRPLWWWPAGDLDALADRIESWRQPSMADYRETARRLARKQTRARHTYVHRAREILATLGLAEEEQCSPEPLSSS